MSKKIDTVGVFIGTIVESGFGLTKKNFPQGIWRLKADQKYIEVPSEIEHYTTQGALKGEPGYVDYTAFDEDALAYLCLFNSADTFVTEGADKTSLLNYEQVKIATGWEGTEFDSFGNGFFVGKKVLFRVDEDTYDGKTSLKVNWVDAADAPPQRQLKSLDASAIKLLNSKLVITKTAPKPAPAKPAAAKAPAPSAAPKPQPTPSTVSANPASPTLAASAGSAAASSVIPPKSKKPKLGTLVETPLDSGPPKECTQMEAWEYVLKNKAGNDDAVVQDAWISATGEVAPDKDEAAITPAEWAKVRDTVLKDIAA